MSERAAARPLPVASLEGVRVFVEIVRAGSLSEAARLLRMPKSTVSLRLTQLETALGATLLLRTTRRLQTTAAGAAYFATATRSLAELDAAAEDLVEEAREPRGTLRVALTGAGTGSFGELISAYLERYPQMRVDLVLGDKRVDLIAEKVDVAVRFGPLGNDASLVARRLGTAYRKVVATPDYLARHPPIRHPRDLATHPFANFPARGELTLVSTQKRRAKVNVSSRFTANAVPAIRHQVLRGHVIGCLPIALVHADLVAGTLVDVLPAWRSDHDPVNIVYHKQPVVPRRVRAFVELAVELLRAPSFMPSPPPPMPRAKRRPPR